ncbi:hypothetical protein BH23CHL7_BH23CHL7_07150 [soil metagenome]
MTDQDFEQRLARRLREHSDHGLRPYDAFEIARAAMASGGSPRGARRQERSGVPMWLRSMALAGLLVVLLVAAAFAGGWIRLPSVTVVPTPSPTTGAEVSPSPSLPVPATLPPTLEPTIEPSPSASPEGSPSPSPEPSPEPSPSPTPEVSPSPEPSPTASPTPATGWREIGDVPVGRRQTLDSVAHGQAGFVIVGRGGSAGKSWFSPDGANWTRTSDTAFPGGAHVVAMGGQFYAISSEGVWRSANGLNWTQVTSSPGLGHVNDVTVENGVMIAVGTDEDFEQAMIWTSSDGASWTSIAAPEDTSELTHVAARGGDIVVIGDGSFEGHGRRIYFRPTHSVGWQRFDAFGEDQDGRLVDIASNGNRFVAVGYWDDGDSGRRGGVAMSSIDGLAWSRTVVSDPEGLVFDQVTVLPSNRFLVIASLTGYWVAECLDPSGRGCFGIDELGLTYTSAQGDAWSPGPQIYERFEDAPSEIGDMVEHPREVAVGPQGVIVVDDWFNGPHIFFAPAGTY